MLKFFTSLFSSPRFFVLCDCKSLSNILLETGERQFLKKSDVKSSIIFSHLSTYGQQFILQFSRVSYALLVGNELMNCTINHLENVICSPVLHQCPTGLLLCVTGVYTIHSLQSIVPINRLTEFDAEEELNCCGK